MTANMARALSMAAVLLLAATAAHADCRDEIEKFKQHVAAEPPDARLQPLIENVYERTDTLCQQGQDETALQTLAMMQMMLDADQSQVTPAAPPQAMPELQRDEPVYERPPDPVAKPDFANRWDQLSQKKVCTWLSAGEVEEKLGLTVTLQQQQQPSRCDFVYKEANGRQKRMFSLYVELHPTEASVRQAERNVSEGFTGSLFEPYDPGAADLHVYISKKSNYLYAFPQDGMTLWRLEFNPDPSAGASADINPGKRFVRLLVQNHSDSLEGRKK